MNAYIVFGETGEYEDRHTWPVAVFQSKRRAETYLKRTLEWCSEHNLYGFGWRAEGEKNPFDPRMHVVDYTGVAYYILCRPLDPPLPKKAEA